MTEKIAGPVDSLTLISGGGQTADYGASLANPVVVEAFDANGVLVPNAAIDFSGTGLAFSPNPATTASSSGPLPVGEASVTVTITQAGSPLTGLTAAVMVNKAANSLNFAAIPAKTYGDAPFAVSATSTTASTGTITYSVASGLATGAQGNSDTATLSGIYDGTVTVAPLNVAVSGFAVTATPASQTLQPGATASLTVNVSSVNGSYTCKVDFDPAHVTSDPALPAGSVVSFNPSSVTPDGTATTMTVTVPSQKSVAMNTTGFSTKAPLVLAALLLPLMAWRRRKNWSGC
ncbi:MAG: hypothetical protein FWD64_11190 [Acidobacteriaceae bacterium]|nr:hypothetical protein [Acidobacteriaceae bacterium]